MMHKKGHIVVDASNDVEKLSMKNAIPEEGGVYLDMEYIVKDKNGNIVSQRREMGDSFLYNFLLVLYCAMGRMFQPDTGSVLTVTDTAGATPTADEDDCPCTSISAVSLFDCNAVSTDDSHGILVGTGSTAVDIEDYALDTVIAHGTGAGEMEYGNHAIIASTSDSSTYSEAGITRTVANNSGDSISVAEVGLACQMEWANGNSNILIVREVLGSPVAVADGLTLTVNVRIKCYS